jgi:hypothetical protein
MAIAGLAETAAVQVPSGHCSDTMIARTKNGLLGAPSAETGKGQQVPAHTFSATSKSAC